MIKASVYIIIFVFLTNLVNAITFNEINYNPEGDDNNKEYIELFSQEPINLSNYTIEDLSSSDTLTLVKSSNSNYYLIVEEGFNYNSIDANIYSAGAAIGNNLNNVNDQITLKDENGTITETFSYNSDMGANNNGKSLCKPINSESWVECEPTPGIANLLQNENQQNQNNNQTGGNNESNQSIIEVPEIIISEIFPNPEGDDSTSEWIELFNKGASINIEGFILKDSSGKTLEINSVTTQSTMLEKNSYLLVYTGSVRGFLNNDKELEISLYKDNIKIDAVSYENAKEGVSFSRIQNTMVYTKPTPNQPNDNELINSSDNQTENNNIEINSQIKILDVKQNNNFLEIIISVFKSNTNKEVIEIFAEDNNKKVTNTAKLRISSKNINTTLNIPLLIIGDIDEDKIKITAEGLDTKDSIEIIKTENLLKESSNIENSPTKTNETIKNTKDYKTNEDPKFMYKSKKLKSKDYAIYLFIVALIITIILLLNKNDKI